jgi:hypothetical protein
VKRRNQTGVPHIIALMSANSFPLPLCAALLVGAASAAAQSSPAATIVSGPIAMRADSALKALEAQGRHRR